MGRGLSDQRLKATTCRRSQPPKARRLLVEIEDRCGGIPHGNGDLFQAFGERRGADRSGLGLGLSIARQAVRAHGGDIPIRNLPGIGCIFTIDVPLAADEVSVALAT